jgi:hypothetical protein
MPFCANTSPTAHSLMSMKTTYSFHFFMKMKRAQLCLRVFRIIRRKRCGLAGSREISKCTQELSTNPPKTLASFAYNRKRACSFISFPFVMQTTRSSAFMVPSWQCKKSDRLDRGSMAIARSKNGNVCYSNTSLSFDSHVQECYVFFL